MGPCSRPMSPGQLELWIIFFFPPEALSCPRHRGHRTSEAERTRWACLPSRCGPASWSFGSFFFFLQKPCLSLSPGALVLLMPRGRDGPVFQADVARSAGALDLFFFFFFLFSSRSPLCPCHRGPCTSEAEGKLWARFSFIDLSVLSVLPVVRSTSCSFEVRFFSLWGHFWATSTGMTSRYSLWPVTFLPVSFMLVIFSICSYWTWR